MKKKVQISKTIPYGVAIRANLDFFTNIRAKTKDIADSMGKRKVMKEIKKLTGIAAMTVTSATSAKEIDLLAKSIAKLNSLTDETTKNWAYYERVKEVAVMLQQILDYKRPINK